MRNFYQKLQKPTTSDLIIVMLWVWVGVEFISAFKDELGAANLVAILISIVTGTLLSSIFPDAKKNVKTLCLVSLAGLAMAGLGYNASIYIL